jgi:predicted transcriptional regulator
MPSKHLLLKVLGNESRLRILLTLARHMNDALTVYKISKFSGLERKVIRAHLPMLVEAGLVEANGSERCRVYGLNLSSRAVQRLIDLFALIPMRRIGLEADAAWSPGYDAADASSRL